MATIGALMRDGRFGGGIERGLYSRHARPGGFPGNMPVHQPMPYEAAARDDLATRAQKAGAAVQRRADEAEGSFQERVQEARATVLGLTRQAGRSSGQLPPPGRGGDERRRCTGRLGDVRCRRHMA